MSTRIAPLYYTCLLEGVVKQDLRLAIDRLVGKITLFVKLYTETLHPLSPILMGIRPKINQSMLSKPT